LKNRKEKLGGASGGNWRRVRNKQFEKIDRGTVGGGKGLGKENYAGKE